MRKVILVAYMARAGAPQTCLHSYSAIAAATKSGRQKRAAGLG